MHAGKTIAIESREGKKFVAELVKPWTSEFPLASFKQPARAIGIFTDTTLTLLAIHTEHDKA